MCQSTHNNKSMGVLWWQEIHTWKMANSMQTGHRALLIHNFLSSPQQYYILFIVWMYTEIEKCFENVCVLKSMASLITQVIEDTDVLFSPNIQFDTT